MFCKVGIGGLALMFLALLTPTAEATFLDTVLTAGALNVFEDNSREAVVDVDNSGTLTTGDVLVGFIRIDNKTAPRAAGLRDHHPSHGLRGVVYAIFSQEISSSLGGIVQNFSFTTTPGLRLSDIVPGAPANGIVAVFSSIAPITDLIVNTPPNSVGGATVTLADYFAFIQANMTLDLIAGFSDPEDFFLAQLQIGVTADANPATGILQLVGTETAANFVAGLSILVNNTAFSFADAVEVQKPLIAGGGITIHDLGISGGNATGASGDPNFNNFGDVSELGAFNQCDNAAGANVPCGFRDNADFGVFPVAVP
jgi:hypothetical protein